MSPWPFVISVTPNTPKDSPRPDTEMAVTPVALKKKKKPLCGDRGRPGNGIRELISSREGRTSPAVMRPKVRHLPWVCRGSRGARRGASPPPGHGALSAHPGRTRGDARPVQGHTEARGTHAQALARWSCPGGRRRAPPPSLVPTGPRAPWSPFLGRVRHHSLTHESNRAHCGLSTKERFLGSYA